eukprot:c19445_g1_i2.p3 GENE.c19445_g1_i2~~c19445_g1_i2.p3  ORF type:complete len:119 (+),score=23.75 c19445_g1_i2:536-892(+)
MDPLRGGVLGWLAGTGIFVPNVRKLIEEFNTAANVSNPESAVGGVSYTVAFQAKFQNVHGRRRVMAFDESSDGGIFIVNGALHIVPFGAVLFFFSRFVRWWWSGTGQRLVENRHCSPW